MCQNARNKINALANIAPFNPISTSGSNFVVEVNSTSMSFYGKISNFKRAIIMSVGI